MVSTEAQVLAVIIGFSGLLFGEVRSIFRTFVDLGTRPFPKFNKYLGMTKKEFERDVDSYHRKWYLGLTKILILLAAIIFEVWMVIAVVYNTQDPLEWLRSTGYAVNFTQCTCCWGIIMLGFLWQERRGATSLTY